MNSIVVASAQPSAGKTSVIAGLAKASGKVFGYIKPFGDRLHYSKKRLWDYDSAVVTSLFGLDEKPEGISLGFEHAKLRFMYDAATIKQKIVELAATVGKGKQFLFVEAGKTLSYGASVNLDASSLAAALGSELLLVASGNEDVLMDDLRYHKSCMAASGAKVAGVIVNKVRDVEDFKQTYAKEIEGLGYKLLGVIPFEHRIASMPVKYFVERLFAKVVGGEAGLDQVIENIFVGAMSVAAALQSPVFAKENKLIITAGDRSDMILAAIETGSKAVVLTNNILPPANIISKATHSGVPLLLVPWDTYYTALQIDRLEPLLGKDDKDKLDLLTALVKKHVEIDRIVKG